MKQRTPIQYFIAYLKPFWKGITVVVILSLLSNIAMVIAPKYLGNAVTDLTKFVASGFTNQAKMDNFYHAIISMIIFYALSIFATFISWIVTTRFNAYATNNMRKNLFGKFQRMTIKYFDNHQDGKLLSLFTSDLDNVYNALNNAVFEVIAQSMTLIGTVVMMFMINVPLAIATVALTPFALIVSIWIMKKAKIYLDLQQAEISNLNGYINEQINGQKVIIANGLQEESVKGFQGYNQKVKDAMFKGQFYSGILFPLMNGLSLLNLAIVIAYGSYMIVAGQVTKAVGLGLIVMFVEYSQNYFFPLTQITSIYSMIQLALTGAKRLARVEAQEEEDQVPDGKELVKLEKGVKLNHVRFSYKPGKEILHDISIDVDKGKSVALVGPTGSGKTTVMNLLNRFYDIDSGEIYFDDTEVKNLTLKSLRNNVGIVLQESVIFTGTILDNIRYGKPDATLAEVQEAAKKANIHDFIMSLPEQYETKVTDENGLFSTGQKQLISIARTLITDPDFLILDEATSNVDTVTEEKIQAAMDNVIKGRTSFVIAHRLKTILNSDKIVVLKNGVIIETGSHAELLKEHGFYYKLYTSQMAFE